MHNPRLHGSLTTGQKRRSRKCKTHFWTSGRPPTRKQPNCPLAYSELERGHKLRPARRHVPLLGRKGTRRPHCRVPPPIFTLPLPPRYKSGQSEPILLMAPSIPPFFLT